MRTPTMRGLMCGAAFGAMAAGFSLGAAQAQDATPAAQGMSNLDEVVVTARRREENMQDVPAAVTALSEQQMRAQQIESPKDVQIVTPSLSVGGGNSIYSKNAGNYSIRGLGQGSFGGASVTSYFAEAPFGPTGPGVPLFDVANVQVLKGPQGTLFGRSNTAGAVLVTPQKPTFNDFYGRVSAKVGNLGRADFDVMVNVPLVEDKLAVRLALNRTHLDGYTKVIQTGQMLDENNSESMRFSVLARPTEWFENYAVYNYYNFDAAAAARVLVAANTGLAALNRTADSFAAICGQAVGYGLSSDVASCQAERVALSAQQRATLAAEVARVQAGGDAVRSVNAGTRYPFVDQTRSHTLVDVAQIKLPDVGMFTFNVKNIFSYQWNKNIVSGDFDGSPMDVSASAFGANPFSPNAGAVSIAQWVNGRPGVSMGHYNEFYSNEFQVNGTIADDFIVWIAGYYLQKAPVIRDTDGSTNLNINYHGILTAHMGPLSATPLNLSGYDKENAYFGQFTADLSRFKLDGVHFTAGYRKTESESVKTTAAAVVNYPSGYITPGAVSTATTESSGVGWIMSLDWKVTPDLLTYITRRKGYKPGGINTLVGASTIPGFVPIYGPETVMDTEIGVKWDFNLAGMRGRINADVYRNDFTDIQRGFSAVNSAGSSAVFTANVAAARLQGFEFEGFIQPIDGLRISATYAYTDAKYTKWLGSDPLNLAPAGTILDLSNMPFANAPKDKASLTVAYDLPVNPDIGAMSLSATWYGQSRVFFNDQALRFVEVFGPSVLDAVSEPGYSAVNARLDWRGIYGRDWDAAFYVRNLTDEVYAYGGGVQLHSVGISNKLYSEPRTYGVELTYRFGR